MSKQPKRTCVVCGHRAKYLTRVYVNGEPVYIGYACTKAHRREAQETRRAELRAEAEKRSKPRATTITCDEYAERYLRWYADENKASSLDTARQQLRRFRKDFGKRPLASIKREEAIDWQAPAGEVARVRAMFSRAMDEFEEGLPYLLNPWRKLGKKSNGRSDIDPPTEEQMILLLDGCSALGEFAPRMRAMLTFACYSIMRPGELFALTWESVDLDADEVHVRQRLYRGQLDLPKSNEARTIALLPQAKSAILELPERHGLVFRNKTGGQMTAPTLTAYWKEVRARARIDLDWYTCSKHFGCHYMKVTLGLPNHDIAHQAGWSERSVEEMVKTYAHTGMGALGRIKAAAAAPTHEPMHDPQESAQ